MSDVAMFHVAGMRWNDVAVALVFSCKMPEVTWKWKKEFVSV